MPIELPQFADTFCEMLTVCSRLKEDSHARDLPDEPFDLTAVYMTPPGKALARLVWSRGQYFHLHIDTALRSTFGKKAPKTTARIRELRQKLSLFNGTTALARIVGFYRIPLTSLPAAGGLIFVGSSAIRLRVKKSEIELTGAQLTFREADIHTIRWELVKDTVFLEMEAYRDLTIGNDYLIDAMSILDSTLDRYVLGRPTDEKSGV